MRHLYVHGPSGVVLAVAENQPDCRVHIAPDWREAYRWIEEFPTRLPDDQGHAISEAGMEILVGTARPGNDGEMEAVFAPGAGEDDAPLHYVLGPKGRRFVACTSSFREFLNVWRFQSKYSRRVETLGHRLWAGQEHFVEVAQAAYDEAIADPFCHTGRRWCYFLKARQLGETTLAVAYDAWVLRFTPLSRVHLVSRTETLARSTLLKPLKFGMQRLPEELQLPWVENTANVLTVDGGNGDMRTAQAYAAKEPGRAESCTHLHLDEWAAMMKTSPELPEHVWASAEPTVGPGGTIHILTTGVGPVGFYADMWKQCVGNDLDEATLRACFIPATGSRPDYTPEAMERKRRAAPDKAKHRREYAETWMDALSGSGDAYFSDAQIQLAHEYARGCQAGPTPYTDSRGRVHKRKYIKAWDIAGPGEHSDAVVGIVLDVTEGVWDVVDMVRNKGESYPTTATRIERLHEHWPGPTAIELNEAGGAVMAFLSIPEDQLIGHRTTRQSKPLCLSEVQFALQAQELKWNPDDVPKLDAEMIDYKLDDENLEQDTVMALSIAVHYAPEAAADNAGRIIGVYGV